MDIETKFKTDLREGEAAELAELHGEARIKARKQLYYLKNKAEIDARNKLWQQTHREQRRLHWKNYRSRYHERILEYARKRNAETREYHAAWHQANKERRLQAKKTRRAANPEKFRQWGLNAIARKRGAEGTHTLAEWKWVKECYDNKCAICSTTERITQDHIIPIKLGGPNSIDNIAPLCMHCNSTKNARIWLPSVNIQTHQPLQPTWSRANPQSKN